MFITVLLDRCRVLLLLALAVALAAYVAFFAAHVAQMLAYPFPLDYGEGPLVAQLNLLRGGTTIWHLYADPAAPPYAVVNYPPVYLLVTLAVSVFTGNGLLAGRVVSLLATLGSVWALVLLSQAQRHHFGTARSAAFRLLPSAICSLVFLSIPVVREWAGYMRVDALALSLGLWGLVVLTKDEGRTHSDRCLSSSVFHPLLAGVLLVLALYTKPSMLAAPVAGGAWWLLAGRASWRVRLAVLAGWAAMALLLFVLLQWASGGWFWLHVFTANTNRWDGALAHQFWFDQLRLRWPLVIAGALGGALGRRFARRDAVMPWCVPLLYTLVGVGTALGVGKVGAYANYFLELYAGLVWLACFSITVATQRRKDAKMIQPDMPLRLCTFALYVLFFLSMAWYSPLWSRDTVRPAGLLEPNPPQLAYPRSGLWRETVREQEVLAALGRVDGALVPEVRAAGGEVFTDTPGVAAAAGVPTPLQAFEHRQLLDSGHWSQQAVLLGLANGSYPLAVIDYLGNWLTPEMIGLITHRYAQDGSLGTWDRYRPVDAGPTHQLALAIGDLRLVAYHLAPPGSNGDAYSPGELVPLALDWRHETAQDHDQYDVVLQLLDAADVVRFESAHPLLYNVFPPAVWPAQATVQHLEGLRLPVALPAGRYTLAMTLRATGRNIAPPQAITSFTVGTQRGRVFDTGYAVPAPLLKVWERIGGIPRAGLPLTPAVRFGWGTLQCFELLCLEQRGAQVTQRPLGDQLFLGETRRNQGELHEPFLSYWHTHGGEANLGPPISGEILRNGHIVQWTRYVRLERLPESDTVALGRLGDDSLRLSPGMHYRWPPEP